MIKEKLSERILSLLNAGTAVGFAVRVILLSTPVWASAVTLIPQSKTFSESFENGDFSEWAEELCCDHSGEVVNYPVRAGSKSAKFTYKKIDYTVQAAKRAELRLSPVPSTAEKWYHVSIFVPTTFSKTSGAFIITQFHSTPDDGEVNNVPPLYLATDGEKLTLVNRWDDREITPKRGGRGESWSLGLLPKDRWVDFVYHVKWSYKSDGILEVFQDGKKVVERTGPNNYNDANGPYMKIGLYASGINSNPNKYNFDQQVLYFDEVRQY